MSYNNLLKRLSFSVIGVPSDGQIVLYTAGLTNKYMRHKLVKLGLVPMAGFVISGVEPSRLITRQFLITSNCSLVNETRCR
jgi:hypothetical protein